MTEKPKVPTERPDPKAAASSGGGGDRPGFDLGGAKDKTGDGSSTIPGGPGGDPALGTAGSGSRGSGRGGTGMGGG